jgi:short/branched chain acyl-CoA dehydrogenase
VARFARDVVAPRVREMDEAEKMDPAVIRGLFEQGVRARALRRCHAGRLAG